MLESTLIPVPVETELDRGLEITRSKVKLRSARVINIQKPEGDRLKKLTSQLSEPRDGS